MDAICEQRTRPGQLPAEKRIRTDTLCLYFSWPIFFVILQVFFLVVIYGRTFSFLHPKDLNGLRCGIDNSQFFPNLSDFQNSPLLSYNKRCISDCDGTTFFSYCIPTSKKELKKSPLPFKIISDYQQYFKFSVFIVFFTFILSFPIYYLCAKYSKIIVYILLGFSCGIIAYLILKTIAFKSYSLFFETVIFGTSYLLFFFYIQRRIGVIGPILTTSFNYLIREKTLFIAPLFILFFSFIIALFSLLGFLFTDGVVSYNLTPSYFSSIGTLTTEQHSSLIITKLLFIILGIWLIEFLFVWIRISISSIISRLYFKHQSISLFESLNLSLKYHCGTIFFGSFVCFALEALSTFFVLLKKWLEKTKNTFVKFVCKCILNLCVILVKFVDEVNRLAFVYISLECISFWDGCKRATNAFKVDSILSIDILMHNIFFGARLIVASIAGILTYQYFDGLGLMKISVPVLVVSFLVYFTLASIDVVLSSAAQTVMVCMLEDAKDEGAYAPDELHDIMVWFKENVGNRIGFHI